MYYFGFDIGQSQDYTALTILRKVRDRELDYQLHVRHAERFPLGVGYPEMIDKLEERINALNMRNEYMVLPDATGVGKPVVDMMRKRHIHIVPITITGGMQEVFDVELGGWKLPKRNLVSNLQVLLQSGQLKFAKEMPFAQELVQELLKFKIKVTSKGNDTYEGWREGDKDDLVLSLAMAAWYACRFGITEEETIERRYTQLQVNPWLDVKGI
jgi:hypothetical protein